jgi:hypothetical protein
MNPFHSRSIAKQWRLAVSSFEKKHHLKLSPQCVESYCAQLVATANEGSEALSDLLKKLNKKQDAEMLHGSHPEALAFKYMELVRFLVSIKVKGQQIDQEKLVVYVTDKLIEKLASGVYRTRFRGGDFRYFIDQEIEYRILDGIRKQQAERKRMTRLVFHSDLPDMRDAHDSLFELEGIQHLSEKFWLYLNALSPKDKLEFCACLCLVYGLPPKKLSLPEKLECKLQGQFAPNLPRLEAFRRAADFLASAASENIAADALRKRFHVKQAKLWEALLDGQAMKGSRAARENLLEDIVHQSFQ